ncbi:hypothetical protein CASFOL_004014 [Castilleja foliolosa]|uniref:Uncharacterized protein n=1 Tax=Castilleja foliolosa TaxID=1961234 RepID=A0ABD3EJ71_9LAMI
MLLATRISRFLLLFVLVVATLSVEYILLQGKDRYAAEKHNGIVSERKTLEIAVENKIGGRKMVYGGNLMKTVRAKKEIGVRAINPRKTRYEASSVAFVADYKGPRRHPPKNN